MLRTIILVSEDRHFFERGAVYRHVWRVFLSQPRSMLLYKLPFANRNLVGLLDDPVTAKFLHHSGSIKEPTITGLARLA